MEVYRLIVSMSQRNTEIQWLYMNTWGIEKIGSNFGMRSGNKGRDKLEMTTGDLIINHF